MTGHTDGETAHHGGIYTETGRNSGETPLETHTNRANTRVKLPDPTRRTQAGMPVSGRRRPESHEAPDIRI